jgi:hypothetical protein
MSIFYLLISLAVLLLLFYDLWYWYHDGKCIVPVTFQIWDCLDSPLRTALVIERVSDGSVGATNISKSRYLGLSR